MLLINFYIRNRTYFAQTYVDDAEIAKKIDLTKPVGFITHGWTDSVESLLLRPNGEGELSLFC